MQLEKHGRIVFGKRARREVVKRDLFVRKIVLLDDVFEHGRLAHLAGTRDQDRGVFVRRLDNECFHITLDVPHANLDFG